MYDTAAANFTIPEPITRNSIFTVSILVNPPDQECILTDNTGVVDGRDQYMGLECTTGNELRVLSRRT